MRIIFNILSVVMVVAVIMVAYLNMDTGLSFIIWKEFNSPNILVFHSRFFQVVGIVLVLGMFIGSCWAGAYYSQIAEQIKEYQKKLEKTNVSSSEEGAKIAVLEEKIKVLEQALRKAIEQSKEQNKGQE